MSQYATSKQALLAALAVCYSAAFAALLVQGPALLGTGGLVPVAAYLQLSSEQLIDTPQYSSAPWRMFAFAPSLLWFHDAVGLSVDSALRALSAAGLALSLAVVLLGTRKAGPLRCGGAPLTLAMGALWFLLLSARNVGQGLLGGPWEALLLEAGWAAVWLAAHAGDAPAPPALLLLRWQLFKGSLLDGCTKLRLACDGADSLAECFARVAAAGPAPGRGTWLVAARGPAWLQAGSLALVLAAQIPGAFLALSPFRGPRLAGAALQAAALLAGAATGAGGGAPVAPLAALCLALVDDDSLAALCTRGLLGRASGGAAAPAAGGAGRAPAGLTPIAVGKGPRRDSLDELLASPKYHNTAAEEMRARFEAETKGAKDQAPAASPLLKPYAWGHANPAAAAGGSIALAAAATAALLATGGPLSAAGAESLVLALLPLAALFWATSLGGAAALSLRQQLAELRSAAAAPAAAATATTTEAATPAASKAAAGKSAARQAADAMLSPPASPPASPRATAKGSKRGKAAAAAPAGEGDSAPSTPTVRGRAARGKAAKEAAAAAAESKDTADATKGAKGDAKSKGAKGKADASSGDEKRGAAAEAEGSKAGKAAAGGQGAAKAVAGGKAPAGGATPVGPAARLGVSGLAALVVALTFVASVADTFWALPAAQQGVAEFVPGLASLQGAGHALGVATGAAPWQQLLSPAAAARDAGLEPGTSLIPVLYGSRAEDPESWEPVLFAAAPLGAADAPPALLPGALGLARPLLAEQLKQAGTGELADHLWLVRLADQLLEGATAAVDLLHPSSPFRTAPPAAVRVALAAVSPASGEGAWWAVEELRELLPPIERGNQAVKDALLEMYWTERGDVGASAGGLAGAQRAPAAVGWAVAAAAALGVAARHVLVR